MNSNNGSITDYLILAAQYSLIVSLVVVLVVYFYKNPNLILRLASGGWTGIKFIALLIKNPQLIATLSKNPNLIPKLIKVPQLFKNPNLITKLIKDP